MIKEAGSLFCLSNMLVPEKMCGEYRFSFTVCLRNNISSGLGTSCSIPQHPLGFEGCIQ
jgi:hypothetical protein